MLLNAPSHLIRHLLVKQVRAVFHDSEKGESPVVRSDDGLFEPGSVIRRVHGDVTTMMIGGVTALLLQMLHPGALAGIWDHSTFRDDMLGRLRRTARFIAVTTYGDKTQALSAIAHVRQVHDHVRGMLDDGTPYAANDPRLLAWVHVCEAVGFLDAWIAFGDPAMPLVEQDRYFVQAGQIARALGADPVPESRAAAEALMAEFMPELAASPRTHEVARMVLTQPPPSALLIPVQAMLMQASVDILPHWAKALHRRDLLPLTGPAVRAGAFAVAKGVRWAFRQNRGPGGTKSAGA